MSIKLSPKYGVNPSISVCPICGKESGVALFGRIKGDKEAPKYSVGAICDDCEQHIKDGHIAILESESETKLERTGRYIWIPKDAINIDCPKSIAIMVKDEFDKTFN